MITFSLREFEYFAEQYQRNREYNKLRLKVRRKLGELGSLLLSDLKNRGLDMVLKTSLHHPYSFNKFAVDSQWVYFSPAPSSYKILKEKLGPDLGKDLGLHYIHTILVIGICHKALFISLKVHQNAWWHGQNLKNKCGHREQRVALLELLNKLEKFSLRLHDWPNCHICNDLQLQDISNYFRYYTPGEHWFHLDCDICKSDPIATTPEFVEFAKAKIQALIPVYDFIVWSPDNDYVF